MRPVSLGIVRRMPRPLEPSDLAEVVGYFDSLLAFRQHHLRVPGVQAAVYADGAVAFSGSYGHADVENDVELTDRHLFRIASHSKTFTATAVLQLAEEGRLRLDDTVGDHLPDLVGSPVGPVRLRDLLSHSSGMTRDGVDADFWQLGAHFPDEEGLLAVLQQPRVLEPYARFKYSNIGYGLLGLVIAAVAGSTYNDRVSESIVERLGLRDLGPELDPNRRSEYAVGYSSLSYSRDRLPIEHVDTAALAAATGFYATATDLVRYFAAHLPGDGRLLSDESKRQMQHPVWDTGVDDHRYGLGLVVDTIGDREVVGHSGGYPGHITRTIADPSTGIVVSVLTNAIDGPADPLARLLIGLVDLARKDSRPELPVDPGRFTGRFANLWGVTDIALVGGRLFQVSPAQPDPLADPPPLEVVGDSTLRVTGGDGFGAYGEQLRYVFAENGGIQEIRGAAGVTMWPAETFRPAEHIRPAS